MAKKNRTEKGRRNKLVGQAGEYLASAELARRNFIATPFSGNVPEFDILAIDNRLKTIPIQVKTIRGGSWQFNGADFLTIEFDGKLQAITGKKKLTRPNLIYIFVILGEGYGGDAFYLLEKRELQNIIYRNYRAYLKKKGGMRPKNPASTHCSVAPDDLAGFQDNWKALLEQAEKV
jgi:hypothetical protein